MGYRTFLSCALLAALLAGGSAVAETGKAVGVDPQADARSRGTSRTLVVGADVGIGETVVTGQQGKVELIFTDRTKLVVGPGSSLLIEDYLLRQDGSPGQFAVNALKGSFRFITGRSPKDNYEITTATGTIGVRGTEFDFVVDPGRQETHIVLFGGAVTICNTEGVCTDLINRCEIATFGAGGANILTGTQRAQWQRQFPFANSSSSVSAQFRVQGASSCMTGPSITAGPGEITVPGGSSQDTVNEPPTEQPDEEPNQQEPVGGEPDVRGN